MHAEFAVARINCHDLDKYVCTSMKERTAALCIVCRWKQYNHSLHYSCRACITTL